MKMALGSVGQPTNRSAGISDYAYTNEHEFFAVLSEYFFGSPEVLRTKAPSTTCSANCSTKTLRP